MTKMQSTPGAQYNFSLPIRDMESDLVRLTPFIPSKHARDFHDHNMSEPEIWAYLPYGPFNSIEEMVDKLIIGQTENSPDRFFFAIYDKAGGGERLAGVVGILNISPHDACTEIGFIEIFREFQRTHVSTHAIGLVLHYLLELPDSTSRYGGGLGLRRVQWQAHTDNKASIRAAERMGFRFEGIMRWRRVIPQTKPGLEVPSGRACDGPKGRHSAILSLCWDDWELEGGRELVERQMERKI